MSPLLTWTRRILIAVLALATLLAGGVYAGSELVRRRVWDDIPATRMGVLPTDASSVAEGGRLARVLGCYGDCHGARLEGRVFFSEHRVADLVAPNLTRIVPSYSDDALARAIRHGVRRDGTGLLAMPSPSFYHLSDEDLGRVIAFLRRQPRENGHDGPTAIGPIGRLGIVSGRFPLVPATMDHGATRVPAGTGGDDVARGRYLARVACSECHGAAFEGGLEGRAPPLAIAATYTDQAFRHLLRTGETPGRRPLYLMSATARARFAHLTDDEITALLTFARTLR
jgi:mono/diheme cytochrome c family protein